MKIELNIKTDTLIAVNSVLKRLYQTENTPTTFSEKVFKSIGYDLADKFDKKAKTRIKKADLFEEKKTNKITLKYHEAWGLEQILIDLKPIVRNSYQATCIQNFINTINQKLA